MISKNSFLASISENNKRRIWLWIVSALVWFFYYPVLTVLLLSNTAGGNFMEQLTAAESRENLIRSAQSILTISNLFTYVITGIGAVVCAVQGFSYLYSRKKVDLYHSVPVSRTRRFLTIYINGVLIGLLPYTIGLSLGMAAAGMWNAVDAGLLGMVIVGWILNVVLFFGIYGMTVLAVMLTGKLLVSLLAAVVFLVYEVVLIFLDYQYKQTFFQYFSSYEEVSGPWFHPAGYILMLSDRILTGGEGQLWRNFVSGGGGVLLALVLALAFTALAYVCYRIRPSEAAERSMAFSCTKGVVKILLVVPFALTVVLIVRELAGHGTRTGFVLFGMAVSVVLGSCVIEVIYESDIRAALRKKKQILAAGLLTAGIYSVYCFDLTGFDSWLPEEESLEEAVCLLPYHSGGSLMNQETGYYMTQKEFMLQMPGVRNAAAVRSLLEHKGDPEKDPWCHVAYRMKNGRICWRYFPLDPKAADVLNDIIGSEEYKAAAYPLYDDSYSQICKQYPVKSLVFHQGIMQTILDPVDLDTLLRAWKQDMKEMDYDTLTGEFQSGEVRITLQREDRGNFEMECFVYPSFTHTIRFLKELGVDTDQYLPPESVQSVTVTNYHYSETSEETQTYSEKAREDRTVEKTFTDPDKIQDILEAGYPMLLQADWRMDAFDPDYYVEIVYKKKEDSYEIHPGLRLITDRIPQWLEEATALPGNAGK